MSHDHLIAICKVCGSSYDCDFEPALQCHWGVDDWEVFTYRENDDLVEALLDLTDEWHEGAFGAASLQDVILARTGWTVAQFNEWVSPGTHAELGGFRVD